MATKATAQISILDLTDAYSVMLTLDNYTFQGDSNSADPERDHTFSTQVIAMCGADIVEASVNVARIIPAIGSPFDYIIDTTSPQTNDGRSPVITIRLPANMADTVTVPGTIRIPVTVGDITIDKDIAYSIAYHGGSGTVIEEHSVLYQAGTSGTIVPDGEWDTSIPELQPGQYLWTKTEVIYSDGTTTTSYSVGYNGSDGVGRGVESTIVEYAVCASGTTAPEDGWQLTIPDVPRGSYLWTRTTVLYTDGQAPSVSYSVALHGLDGDGAITVKIYSSNGTTFKDVSATTTLTARVYAGAQLLNTAQVNALGMILWYRDGTEIVSARGSNTLTVTGSDITGSTVYEARLEG